MEETELNIRVYNATTLIFFCDIIWNCLGNSASASPKKMHNLPVVDVEWFVPRLRVAQIAPAPKTVAAIPNTMERVSLIDTI
jgi:hypothetical protein